MLKGFQYGGNAYQRPDNADLSELDLESGTDMGMGGLSKMIEGLKDKFGDNKGGGEAALKSPEGSQPGGMGDIASLAAAEEGMEDENSGWMARAYGEGGDPAAAKEAMSNPWNALAAVMMGGMFKKPTGL